MAMLEQLRSRRGNDSGWSTIRHLPPKWQAKAAGVNPNFFSFTGFVAKKAIDLSTVEPPRKKPKLVPSVNDHGSKWYSTSMIDMIFNKKSWNGRRSPFCYWTEINGNSMPRKRVHDFDTSWHHRSPPQSSGTILADSRRCGASPERWNPGSWPSWSHCGGQRPGWKTGMWKKNRAFRYMIFQHPSWQKCMKLMFWMVFPSQGNFWS